MCESSTAPDTVCLPLLPSIGGRICNHFLMSLIAILKLIAAFSIGAIPFAVVAMWGTGLDVTRVGSKNPGFNNVLRVSTRPRAAFALFGDLSKGALAVFLLSSPTEPEWFLWGLGLAAVAGHCWTPFLKFNGGKGVATMAGALLYLEFGITVSCLILYPTLRIFGRKMGWAQEGAISSMTTMTVISVLIFILRGPEAGVFSFIALAIVVIRHAPNIRQLLP